MVLEIIVVLLLILGICVVSYRGAVHEFQILQKDYIPDAKFADLLSEQLPLVIRNLPHSWTGNWTHARCASKAWPVTVTIGGRRLRTTFDKWIQDPSPVTPDNAGELAGHAKLGITITNWEFRRWYYLAPSTPRVSILRSPQCSGIRKTVADSTVIVATDGAPLEIWVSHEAGIPANIVEELRGKDPWIQTTNEIPGVSDVKFIEVKLRAGNALAIPCHWWYAVRPVEGAAWFWTADFHSPISWAASCLLKS